MKDQRKIVMCDKITKDEAFKILLEKEKEIEIAKAKFEEWKTYCLSFAQFKKGQKVRIICEGYSEKMGYINDMYIGMPWFQREKPDIKYKIGKIKKDGTQSKRIYPKWRDFKEEDFELIKENEDE